MATAPFVSGFHGTGAIQRIHGVRPADPRLDPTRIPCGARVPPPQPRRALPAFPTRIQREPIAERSAGSPSHAQGSTRRLAQSASGSKGQRGFGDGENKARRKRGDGKRTPATLLPMHALHPLFASKGKGTRPLREKWQKEYRGGGDGKGGGKKREPAPPSEARANPSRKRRHGRARQTLCRSLRRSLSQILPEGTEGASGRKALEAPRPKSARNAPDGKNLRTASAGRTRCKTRPDGWA